MCETADHVRVRRDVISYDLGEKNVERKLLSEFLKAFHDRWPFIIVDEAGNKFTIARFLPYATPDP
jgi:hypothetical protein